MVTSCGCDSRSPAAVMRTKTDSVRSWWILAHPTYPIPLLNPPTIWYSTSPTGPLYGTRPSIPSGTSFLGDSSPSWKYRSALPSCMADRDPMPRIILKRRPSSRNDSPGLSSVPASIEPIITDEAPAARAFTMSPEYLTPPSAITGMSPAPSTASITAVSCGTPTPVTTRVVQMDPGPTPTFTASTPRATRAAAPSREATLPAISCTFGTASRTRAVASRTPSECPCAVSITRTSAPASANALARSR